MSQPGHLNGLHHVTAITGDARRNLDFYTGVLGLRLVAKSVNQDDPRAYHLYYGDERGTPGAVISFFEYARAIPGRAGAGMVHRIAWRVASAAALDFWDERLAGAGICIDRRPERLLFSDPDGLGHELAADVGADAPLVASHPEIPAQLALQGLSGVRAYASQPELTGRVLADVLAGARRGPRRWELRGSLRGGWIAFDQAPSEPAVRGAGTVHHVAFGTDAVAHPHWEARLRARGMSTSGVIDRHFFRSIYFREPGGLLIAIADDRPGFAPDQPRLTLPHWLEDRRPEIELRLTPLPNPRAEWPALQTIHPLSVKEES
jgi:glyoxalase family protein